MKEHVKKHKKLYKILGIIIVLAVIVWFAFGRMYIKRHFSGVSVNVSEVVKLDTVDTGDKHILTVYFTRVGNSHFEEGIDAVSSASLMSDNGTLVGNSELLAKMVQSATNSDIYAISTMKVYPSSYTETCMVAKDEFDADEVIEFREELPNLSGYTDVILVYPVWWMTIPNAVKTFLQQEDMTGINLHLVATHGGSGVAQSLKAVKEATNANVDENVLDVFDDDVSRSADKVSEFVGTVLLSQGASL